VVPALKPLYDYAWFVGFFAAGLTHLVLARVPGAKGHVRQVSAKA
jgi:cytosine/uracil/thiamine/allantoin permease